MSNEIATRAEPAAPAGAATSELVLWAYEAQQAHQIAISLSKTSFVPQSLRGKPDDITAAILAGQELGMQPMSTLRSIDVIQGTPALRAHAMRALVQRQGHRIWLVEQSPTRVVMRGQRYEGITAGGPAFGPEQEVVWTIDRAQQLGLTSKDQWKKQPQTMLTARATGEICRLIASDALHAMPYASEELRDSDQQTETAAPARRVTAAEITGEAAEPALETPEPAAESEPPLDGDWPEPAEPGGAQ